MSTLNGISVIFTELDFDTRIDTQLEYIRLGPCNIIKMKIRRISLNQHSTHTPINDTHFIYTYLQTYVKIPGYDVLYSRTRRHGNTT